MPAEHRRQDCQTRSSINTRAQSKRINCSTEIDDCSLIYNDVSMDRKKRKRYNLLTDTKRVQKNIFHKDDSTNNAKRIKKSDGLHFPESTSPINDFNEAVQSSSVYKNRSRNKSLKILQLPTKQTIKAGTSSRSPNAVQTSITRSYRLLRSADGSKKLSRTTSLSKSGAPKKLTLISGSKSPMETRKTDVSSRNKRLRIKSHLSDNTVNTQLSKNTSVTKTRGKNTTFSSAKHGLRKSLKSPKIVLKRLSNSKSVSRKTKKKKKKSSSSSSSPSLRKKESPNTIKCNDITSTMNNVEFVCNKISDVSKIDAANKTTNSATNVYSSTRSRSVKNASAFKQPVVVLQRLSIPVPLATSLLPTSSSLVEADNNSMYNGSPKTSKFNCKNPLKVKNSSKNKPETSSALQKFDRIAKVNDTSETSLEPLMSSTPRNGSQYERRNDKRETIKASEMRNTALKSRTCNVVNLRQETSKEIENEQEEVREKDETYELVEPKTPNLRKQLKKEKEKKVEESFDNVTIATKRKKNTSKSLAYISRERLNSLRNNVNTPSVVKSGTPSFQFGHKLKSVTNISVVSTSPLITPIKKPDPKYSTAKKIPNFVEIHKKIFAKSESIVDAKRRMQEKHLTLITSMNKPMISRKKEGQLPNESSNGLYNRFGFKIRKTEATDCILKKSNLQSMRSKQRTRTILKGVRTNRRFELQMKARNINL